MAGFSVPVFGWLYQGAPASGGSVYVYQTGTTTPVTIYADGALMTPLSNPLPLDANGECKFYVGSAVNIRMDGYTADGIFIESIDPIYIVPDLTSLSSLTSLSFGGFINKFRNGTMDVWQRGTSGTITAGSPAYTADGWIVDSTGANITWAQQSQLANGCSYSLKITGAGSVTDTYVKQRIEGIIAQQLLSGGNVTIQAQITNNTGGVLTPTLTVNHASVFENFGTIINDISAVTLQSIVNASTGQIAYTFTPSASSGNGLEVIIDFGAILNSSSNSVNIFALDIRATPGVASGLNNSPPLPELRPIQAELAFCQRYYYQLTASPNAAIATGWASGSEVAEVFVPFPIPMRTIPTFTAPSNVGHVNANFQTATAIVISNSGNTTVDIGSIQITVASGITASNGTMARWINTAITDFMSWTAEF